MSERDGEISLTEAAERAGVSSSTLTRWAEQRIVPVKGNRWTAAAVSHARVVARMRDRGHSLAEIKRAVRDGRLAFGLIEDSVGLDGGERTVDEVSGELGLETDLIERVLVLMGTPRLEGAPVSANDADALRRIGEILEAGFPLVALLQLIRVYAQSLRRIADAEVRLFHIYVHEPLISDGVDSMEMAEQMAGLADDLLPQTQPLMEFLHRRFLRFFSEQDVVGHMESSVGEGKGRGHVQMTFCFVDLTGFTQYTEEEGDEEALDIIEHFVDTVEATLPSDASLVKTIGDEVMVVSPEAESLAEWAVGLMSLFTERPQPRVGLHYGSAVFHEGDYFGADVNLAHRVVNRALAGEVIATEALVDDVGRSEYLDFDPIGEVNLKGVPDPVDLFVVSPSR